MAITWGGFSGHMRVGIDVWTDGYDTNTPSINVYVAVYIQADSTWDFNDDQTMNLSGNMSGAWNYHNGLSANQSQYIGTYTVFGQGQNYNGGPTYYFAAQVSGHYQGATPWCGVNFTLPARPPNVPGLPGIGVDSVTSTSARVVVSAADGRGAGVDAYETAISLPGPNWSGWFTSFGGGTGTVTGLAPRTTYQAATRAHNAVGWGDFANSATFTTGGTAPAAPAGLSVSSVTPSGARLSWTAPNNGGSPITGYDIQIARNSVFTTGLQTLSDTASPFDFTGLQQHTQYWTRLRAKNAIGAGSYSSVQTFTTLMSVTASAPAGTKNPFSTVTLTGSDVNDATVASRLWAQTSGTPTAVISEETGTVSTAYLPGTFNGTTLVFTYTVTDTAGRTYSASVSVVIKKASHKAVVGGVEVPMEFRAT